MALDEDIGKIFTDDMKTTDVESFVSTSVYTTTSQLDSSNVFIISNKKHWQDSQTIDNPSTKPIAQQIYTTINLIHLEKNKGSELGYNACVKIRRRK